MLAVMSTHCLHKLNHMFVISYNTWHKCGIMGKKGERQGPYILGWEEKRKKNRDDKTDPIFINRTDCRLTCPFGLGSELIKEAHISHSQISFAMFSTPTVSRDRENIKIPERDQR